MRYLIDIDKTYIEYGISYNLNCISDILCFISVIYYSELDILYGFKDIYELNKMFHIFYQI